MRHRKSRRHQLAAAARWSSLRKADSERGEGIEDRVSLEDIRRPIPLDFSCVGGPNVILEPRYGYLAWRRRDAETGEVTRCAALKTLLRDIADELPRQVSPRTAETIAASLQRWSRRDLADAATAHADMEAAET